MLIVSVETARRDCLANTTPRPEHTERLMTIHNRQTPLALMTQKPKLSNSRISGRRFIPVMGLISTVERQSGDGKCAHLCYGHSNLDASRTFSPVRHSADPGRWQSIENRRMRDEPTCTR